MPNIKDLITNFAAKANVDLTSEEFKDAMANFPELERLSVPDNLYTAIDHGLLSIDMAKNNHPDIHAHYQARIYDGLDKKLKSVIEEEKLPDDVVAELYKIPNTYERTRLLVRKVKELESKKANANKGDAAKYAQEIADLNEALRNEKESVGRVREEYENKLREKDMGFALGSLLSEYKTIHDDLPANTKDRIIKTIINDQLQQQNAKLALDENNNLALIRADGNTFFGPDNRPWTPKSFIDKTLSEMKQLKVTEQAPPPAANQYRPSPGSNGQNQAANNFVPGNKAAGSSVVTSRNAQALADLAAAGVR